MKLKNAPTPKGSHWFLGHGNNLTSENILTFYQDSWRNHGDIIRLKVGPRVVHVLADPNYIRHVLIDNSKNYIKGSFYNQVRYLLGNGVLTAEGEEWREQRKIMQKPFTPGSSLEFLPIMIDTVQSLAKRWRKLQVNSESINILHEMRRLTIAIIARTMFGCDVSDQAKNIGVHFDFLTKYIDENLMNPFSLPIWVPTKYNLQFRFHRRELYKIINKFADVSTGCPHQPFSLARHLKENGSYLTEKLIRDQIMTIFLAGHETTSNQLTWMWIMLAKHPRVAQKIRHEIVLVQQGKLPTADTIKRLPYCHMVIAETLRLYPPVWGFPRNVVNNDEIDGYHIPKNSFISLSPYLLQRHPKYFVDPNTFFPERFYGKDVNRLNLQDGFFPFSYGPRKCLGDHFSLLESLAALAVLAEEFELKLLPNSNIEPIGLLTLQPKYPVMMSLHKVEKDILLSDAQFLAH